MSGSCIRLLMLKCMLATKYRRLMQSLHARLPELFMQGTNNHRTLVISARHHTLGLLDRSQGPAVLGSYAQP